VGGRKSRSGNSQAFAGFGQDQCRKRERVVGANTFALGPGGRSYPVVCRTDQPRGSPRSPALSPLVPPEVRPPANSTSSGPAARRCRKPEYFLHHGSPQLLPQIRRSPKSFYLWQPKARKLMSRRKGSRLLLQRHSIFLLTSLVSHTIVSLRSQPDKGWSSLCTSGGVGPRRPDA